MKKETKKLNHLIQDEILRLYCRETYGKVSGTREKARFIQGKLQLFCDQRGLDTPTCARIEVEIRRIMRTGLYTPLLMGRGGHGRSMVGYVLSTSGACWNKGGYLIPIACRS